MAGREFSGSSLAHAVSPGPREERSVAISHVVRLWHGFLSWFRWLLVLHSRTWIMAIPSQADLACRAAELGGRLDDAFSGAVTLCDAGLSGIVGMREPLGGGLRDPLRGTCESQSSIFVSCRSNKALNRSCRSRFLTWQVGWRQLRLTQSFADSGD